MAAILPRVDELTNWPRGEVIRLDDTVVHTAVCLPSDNVDAIKATICYNQRDYYLTASPILP